jgi:GNAT superfamily N-acetyltransferase
MSTGTNSERVEFRLADNRDVETLGRLNAELIRDEGHPNPMSVAQLVRRMDEWLRSDYQAIIFEQGQAIIGYALFRREPDHVYLRQLFVRPENRRQSVGRHAVKWIGENVCREHARIRIDVLMANEAARSFWSAIGFHEYCVTMEMDLGK